MWSFLHRLSSPRYFYTLSGRLLPWFGWPTLLLMLTGVYWGLVIAPTDYQQGNSYRIIFIHVPSAWLSLFAYVMMAACAAIAMIWKIKLAEVMITSIAPVGASFTFLALVTGSLWGKPTWGTWWVWDARLTSELVLLFLYLGVIALNNAIEDKRKAARASGILAIVGVVNIPIIKFSVDWWNTLHQGATITLMQKPAMDTSMLIPLLIMALAFKLYFFYTLLKRARCEVLEREKNSQWVRTLFNPDSQPPQSPGA